MQSRAELSWCRLGRKKACCRWAGNGEKEEKADDGEGRKSRKVGQRWLYPAILASQWEEGAPVAWVLSGAGRGGEAMRTPNITASRPLGHR